MPEIERARERVGVVVVATDARDAAVKIAAAEEAGVRQAWVTMSGAKGADALTTLAGAAAATEEIRVGTAIVPIYPRHPLTLAHQALAIHDIAPGRLRLGIGPGERRIIEELYGLVQSEPLAYLREYVEVLRRTLWDGTSEHRGAYFRTGTEASMPARVAPVPLLISALGPAAFRLAGEMCDGAQAWMTPPTYLLDVARPAVDAGARSRDRTPPPVIAHLLVAVHDDATAALKSARQRIDAYNQYQFFRRMFTRVIAGQPTDTGLDGVARELTLTGDDETVTEGIRQVLTSGIDELQLSLLPIHDETDERHRLLRLVGELPA